MCSLIDKSNRQAVAHALDRGRQTGWSCSHDQHIGLHRIPARTLACHRQWAGVLQAQPTLPAPAFLKFIELCKVAVSGLIAGILFRVRPPTARAAPTLCGLRAHKVGILLTAC